ncbi:MAG: nuclear transport factor 2 family protein, partial [Bacteroidota bacterium]
GDVAAIRKGFHEQFTLLGRRENNQLRTLTRDEWIKIVEQKKEAGKYPPADAYKVKVEFLRIDIVEEVASVKLAFYEGEKLAYIDFLALYKFEEGWKIMNKVYHTMPE